MHRRIKKSAFVLAGLLCCTLLLAGCAEKVKLSTGKYEVEETLHLQAIVTPEDLALLEGLSLLESADFSGSACVEEIFRWAETHPQVAVTYTLPLPTGKTVDNHVQALDLSGLDDNTLRSFTEKLPLLSAVKEITLGDASALSRETLDTLAAACPEVKLDYSVTMLGKSLAPDTDTLVLKGIDPAGLEEVLSLLPLMGEIAKIDLSGAALSWEEIGRLAEACPEAVLDYSFSLYGKTVNLKDEELDFSYMELPDKGAALRQALPYMKNCRFVNMDSCGISNEDMAALQADFPGTKIVWRVFFGRTYTLRTDAEKVLASKPSIGGTLYDKDLEVLKYCTDLKYVDIGHNLDLTSLAFASHLPKLEVLVIAMNVISDISPLANCPNLEYLELNSTQVSDLSPLAELKNLRHLNIGNCPNVSDISPLYGLTELERLWIGCVDPVPPEQVAEMQKRAPDCVINTEIFDPTGGGWRVTGYTELSLMLFEETGWLQEVLHPRYELLRKQFGYVEQDYSFYYNDPSYLGPALGY